MTFGARSYRRISADLHRRQHVFKLFINSALSVATGDRCDCENGFDELKNQWGLSGFTTQDITRCQTTGVRWR